MKPLGKKSYGSIGHLPNSRLGPGDHKVHEGQAAIACEKVRDKHDIVIVQEKLDGSNVGVALLNGEILPLSRAGYLANTSPYSMHHYFYAWAKRNESRFRAVLKEGERICGEWLMVAHGTIYELPHEPFVAFDIFRNDKRLVFEEFIHEAAKGDFTVPSLLYVGGAFSVESAIKALGDYGHHGAQETVEGAVWRIERQGEVDFLCKYVRPDKQDGKYLGEKVIFNSCVEKTERKAA